MQHWLYEACKVLHHILLLLLPLLLQLPALLLLPAPLLG
jgi:hypothetical protein